jgi:phage repressor protein C with HTH and peptisase S24 domain
MGLGERIEALLQGKGWSQAELARRVGVQPTTIWKLVSGGTQATRHLHAIARELETTPEYLLGETSDPAPTVLTDRRLGYRAPEPESDVVEIDQVDLRFGLGGSYFDAPAEIEKRRFSREWLGQITRSPPELLFWAETDGDSMEPTIRSGEIVLGDRSQTTPRSADGIWAIAMGDIGMIKRLRPLRDGTVEILSDNPVVPPDRATDGELHVIGRVVAVVRRL